MMDAGTLDFATFMNTMRNDNGFGGNNSWIWILFLFFFFGGYGGFGMNRDRMATAAEQQLSTDFIYSNLNSQIRGMNEGLIQGFSGLNTNLLKGFDGIDKSISASTAFTGDRINGLERGICNLGYELKSTIDNCCCTTGKAIQQFGYENQLGILNQTNALNQTMSALGDKIDNRCFLNSGEIFVKFALKDDLNNSYIQIPHNIKIKINPSFITSEYTPASVQEIMVEKMVDKAIIKVQDFIDKDLNNLIKETINNNYSLNNIVEETHNTLSTFMNKINDKLNFSEDFIIKNNKIYLNKQEKYEYENIYINYIEKIQSDHLIKTEEGHVYEQISDNLYIHYNINTERPYDDTLLQDLHNFAIDYYKNKAYFILEEEKRKLLEQCLTVYFFGIGNPDICNQTKLLNWYRQQEEKITSYNDLSTEIIINKF